MTLRKGEEPEARGSLLTLAPALFAVMPAEAAVIQLVSRGNALISTMNSLAIPWAEGPGDGVICDEVEMNANWSTTSKAGTQLDDQCASLGPRFRARVCTH